MSILQDYLMHLKPARSAIAGAMVGGSIHKPEDRARAIRLMREGQAVGVYVRGVSVIWVDAANPEAVGSIQRIKGERRTGQPLTTIVPPETLAELTDAERIHPPLRGILLDPRELAARLGGLCLIRVPVQRDAVARLPSAVLSQSKDGGHQMQSWVYGGESDVSELVDELWERGVEFPGVTSMNTSGKPEIVDQGEAEVFCAAHGIPLFLRDSDAGRIVRGSFPILEADQAGMHLIREGHFPADLFRRLLDGAELDRSRAKPGKYPLVRTDALRTASSPYRLHDELVRLLDGTAR